MAKKLLAAAFLLSMSSAWAQEMTVEFADPVWDGKKIPEAHNCNSPTAATPPLKISGLPPDSDYVTLSFRDLVPRVNYLVRSASIILAGGSEA